MYLIIFEDGEAFQTRVNLPSSSKAQLEKIYHKLVEVYDLPDTATIWEIHRVFNEGLKLPDTWMNEGIQTWRNHEKLKARLIKPKGE